MSALGALQEARGAWEPPPSKPLDEALWQAWVARGRAEDRRSSAARLEAVKWVSIAALVAAAGPWSNIAPYETLVRFIVTLGSMVVMLQALHARQYAAATVFGALALLYNPFAPVFSFSGGWQRAVVVASASPFIASVTWRNARTERHD